MMTAPSLPSRPDSAAGPRATTSAMAGRTLRTFWRNPEILVVGTIQSAMFLFIFRYVFGGAIGADLPGGYVNFLVPGFVVGGLLFSGMAAAAGVAADVEGGLVDRLRSLPVSRPGILAGRAVADTTLVVWGLLTATGIGVLVGFRFETGVGPALAALGLCIVFGFSFAWMFISIGLLAGSVQAAQGISMVVFPLAFVSSAYVPVETMPGWMQPVADNQPLTAMIGAVRGLVLDDPALIGRDVSDYVVASLLWCVALLVVFVPLAAHRYRRV